MAARRAFDGWSRLVGWLKVALPLLALALLSTLFLVSNRIDPDAAIPYAKIDVKERLREPRITAPVYSAVTRNGSALTVSASEARPAQTKGGLSTATSVTATLLAPDGKRTELAATTATLDEDGARLQLTGKVRIDEATGYSIQTDRLDADLARTAFFSPGPVTALGPTGTVTADSMSLTPNPKEPKAYLLVFNGNVKLVYQPE